MLTDRVVAVTLIICATAFACVAVSWVGYLAATGHDTAAVGLVIGGPLVTVLGMIAGRLRSVQQSLASTSPGTPVD